MNENNLPDHQKIKKEIRSRTIGYIVAALGIVAGLAWNDAVRALIDAIFPLKADSLIAKFIYAVIITVIVVMVSIYLLRLTEEKEKK